MEVIIKNKFYFLLCFVFLGTVGCSTIKVTRLDLDERVDLSGNWNDYDAMIVSKEMVKDSLNRPWMGRFRDNQGRTPVVIVDNIANNSHEHINTQVFTKYLEKELLNSGRVIFVATADERVALRKEREDQQGIYTLDKTRKEIGLERGADFILIGSIDSVTDDLKGKSVVLYQVNLELIDLISNEKVWIGQKKIRKFIERRRYSF